MNGAEIKKHIADSLWAGMDNNELLTDDEMMESFCIPAGALDGITGEWVPLGEDLYDPIIPSTVTSAELEVGVNYPPGNLLVIAGYSGMCVVVWAFRPI